MILTEEVVVGSRNLLMVFADMLAKPRDMAKSQIVGCLFIECRGRV